MPDRPRASALTSRHAIRKVLTVSVFSFCLRAIRISIGCLLELLLVTQAEALT